MEVGQGDDFGDVHIENADEADYEQLWYKHPIHEGDADLTKNRAEFEVHKIIGSSIQLDVAGGAMAHCHQL